MLFLCHSPVVLEFDLKLIARKTFSTVSYTEKYALQHTESPKESSEGKAWKMSHTVSKFIRIISINTRAMLKHSKVSERM